jgi:hypothetical protein
VFDFLFVGDYRMSALPSLALAPGPTSRRTFRRYPLAVRVDVITLRSGIPDSLPGRCTDLSEDGVGAIIAGDLTTGQQIGIELRLPHINVPVQARALIRHDQGLHFGLQFLKLTPEQREMIRYWAYRSTSQQTMPVPVVTPAEVSAPPAPAAPANEGKGKKRVRIRRRRFFMLLAVILTLVVLAWWHWQKAWQELEKPIAAAAPQRTVEAGDSANWAQVASVETRPNRTPGHP